MKNITVAISDLKLIGNTMFGDNDDKNSNLHVICDGNTCNIEKILLRNILEITGNKILEMNDHIWTDVEGKEVYDIEFITDFKWFDYLDLDTFILKFNRDNKIDTITIIK